MNRSEMEKLAKSLRAGRVSLPEFIDQVAQLATPEPAVKTAKLAGASLDLDRSARCGFPEVVYGEGKTAETIIEIFQRQRAAGQSCLATRVDAEKGAVVAAEFADAHYNPVGRTVRLGHAKEKSKGKVGLITAGSSDLPVAEEARETLLWMNVDVTTIHDVGVAGPHRLPERIGEFADCDAVIVVAGMEGALPSVVGGYLACPVIATPTSVGYGASFGGVAALLGMLNSCASNVTVVNIDAGFRAAYNAGIIATRRRR
ncbi:nickel pincer cofactor biosynthesis protein LarB [Blastopirellula sp. JC732]|uniref:Nickel pincer cofactor biosynthesis protein LarB n=1 Tax=Blastopirellula sediminis TaxID=2894196 RepID=A0A9X1MS97_9BACT|nr:nickel pincer cofactor biosynthesis protein LarB [Blastopirellula sediminis]MCC9605155.1 nickel pincer cofactor biosynthesis protein LarB [Blastopirellula sediminis]MCC9631545.1 nickel pincer cofactor biosynthesis protein LarB [Blastopirellula sediminis]